VAADPKKRKLTKWLLALLSLATIGLLALRGYLVSTGVLYGESAVTEANVVVASVAALSVSLWLFHRTGSSESADEKKGPVEATTSLFAIVTGFASAVTLIISGLNLVVPAEAPNLAKPACPGVRDRAADYVGITGGDTGVNSHSGPNQSYEENGRFPTGCSIAFSTYCIGEPIVDSTGKNSYQVWTTSRWLLIAKQHGGIRSWLADHLSGENPSKQLISDAFVTPETPYSGERHDASMCGDESPEPEKAKLAPLAGSRLKSSVTLTATAKHAANMGFGIWIPPGEGFTESNSYDQIYNTGTNMTTDDNPGMTAEDGSKKTTWQYGSTLAGAAHAEVVVMAVPCIADNFPASEKLGATATYDVGGAGRPTLVRSTPSGLDRTKLTLAACRANT
jgi:hypothetical protein